MPELPSNLYEPIRYILALGGKRLRPVLTLLASEMFEGELKSALAPAIAIEIFHNFTLVHDDILDRAETRRGKLTVHKKWNENIAILAGDTMQYLAYNYFCEIEDKYLKQCLLLFNKTAIQICEGQQLDMDFETNSQVTTEDYLTMIKLKTAVLIAFSLKIGAIISGASADDSEAIYNFGLSIGEAFQLQDDLLDCYGDFTKFGKKIGNDILANKKTYLLITALNLSEPQQHKKISYLITNEIDEAEKINRMLTIYDSLNIKQLTEAKISECYEKANYFLAQINLPQTRKKNLENFVQKLLARNF